MAKAKKLSLDLSFLGGYDAAKCRLAFTAARRAVSEFQGDPTGDPAIIVKRVKAKMKRRAGDTLDDIFAAIEALIRAIMEAKV